MQDHPAAALFEMLEGAELQELADDIKSRGLLHPVTLYEDPELGRLVLDGRNRLRACELAGVEARTSLYTGDDPVGFVISENVRRRHLTDGQKASVAARALPLFEAEAAKRKVEAGKQYGEAHPKRSVPVGTDLSKPQRSADRAAKTAGSSGRSVARYKRIKEQAPDLALKVDKGGISLARAERVIRDQEAEQKRVAQAKRDATAAQSPLTVDLRHGDFREVLADLTEVDAIITDPPYPHEFIPLLADLAVWADKVLKPDGVLAVLMGQTYLPEVYRLLDGYREYRWTACYLTPAAGYVSQARRVQSNWKPLIIYGGGPRFADVVKTAGDTGKEHHKWGQDFTAFSTIVERLTVRGQTVVDPFMGAGTTLLAAHALGRHSLGCDISAEHVATARERLA